MAEVNININGRNFAIQCEAGQEPRVAELGNYVDGRVKGIAGAGAANNEAHLLVLAALMLADEVFDAREEAAHLSREIRDARMGAEQEAEVATAISDLAERIEQVSGRIQGA
ncbi:MAG: cell division protein ZapA [Micavibrio sp.]|nr:cell division protein ZapA [Micavibrio sp.]